MASYMEMSLEDIIKRKKRENVRMKGPQGVPKRSRPPKKDVPPTKRPIFDARNKIISKKRTQITDAREKLAQLAKQKDARLKLEQMRKKRMSMTHIQGKKLYTSQSRQKFMKNPPILNDEVVFVDRTRQVVSQPLSRTLQSRSLTARRQVNHKRLLESRSIGPRSSGDVPKLKPILRTVENDLDIIDDPMGEEYVPPKPSALNRNANLQLRIIAHNNDIRESRSSVHRQSSPVRQKSPPRPPSILKKRPMAALRNEKKTDKPSLEYRIIVSNLRNTVTGGDIEELFGDVGGMVESRLVRPGTAEVIYKSVEDAQKAVELYHNRQLDGQPMNCLLVTPRSSTAAPTARNGSKPALYSTNSNVEPDISTFHKVLFSNF
ncbi:polymerase delta-interacting protein 3-like [Hyposmocoma kahamanoa]|uniref:polymerase delta-interacting protein 3-like n=1 Tax=Hyposmocoma kahamanoa TaxID=1477025 RepID=UPI000E6DA045|nr:polymerase delta-interacting protein 3-like [Hyposmocoma kahamanoa]